MCFNVYHIPVIHLSYFNLPGILHLCQLLLFLPQYPQIACHRIRGQFPCWSHTRPLSRIYHCQSGHTQTGSSCSPSMHCPTLPIPSHQKLFAAKDKKRLTTHTTRSHRAPHFVHTTFLLSFVFPLEGI